MKFRKILLAATLGGILFSITPVLAGTDGGQGKKMYVTPEIGLNVRTGPGIENEKIDAYVCGTEVEVLDITENNWAVITYNNGQAYMCADYLNESTPEEEVTGVQPEVYEEAAEDYEIPVVEEEVAEDYDEPDYYVSSTGGTYYGTCRITHYCNCAQCCGQWAGGATASGAYPTAGRTVAMDLPFGTKVKIGNDPTVYVVEDRGVSGAAVDVYCGSHSEALASGMYYADVYIVG